MRVDLGCVPQQVRERWWRLAQPASAAERACSTYPCNGGDAGPRRAGGSTSGQHRCRVRARIRGAAAARALSLAGSLARTMVAPAGQCLCDRSEEHTSELQSLMRISYAVFCLKKKKKNNKQVK